MPPIAVNQPINARLKDRYRGQAPSHMGSMLFLKSVIRFRAARKKRSLTAQSALHPADRQAAPVRAVHDWLVEDTGIFRAMHPLGEGQW